MILLSLIRKNLDDRQQLREAEKRLENAREGSWASDSDPWIKSALESDNWQIRNVAVKLVGEGKKAGFAADLIGLLLDLTQTGFVRRNSAKALSSLITIDDSILQAFFKGLDDPYWEVRTESAVGLSIHGRPDAVMTEGLLGKIYNKSPLDIPTYPIFWPKRIYREKNFEVRAAMLRALGTVMSSINLIHALEIPLDEDIWKVREAALDAYVQAARRFDIPLDRIRSLLSGMDLTCTEFVPTFPIRLTYSRLSNHPSPSQNNHPADRMSDHAI